MCARSRPGTKKPRQVTDGASRWAMPDSNRRPLPCEGSALPTAPIARVELCRAQRHSQKAYPIGGGALTPAGRPGVATRKAIVRHARRRGAVWRCADPGLMYFKCPGRRKRKTEYADVAQLVAHHLAKVRVASSSLVIRSSAGAPFRGFRHVGSNPPRGGVAERLGTGLQSRLHGFESRRHLSDN